MFKVTQRGIRAFTAVKWSPNKCGFIGGGAMAEAILQGFLKTQQFTSDQIYVTDVSEDRRTYLKERFNINVTDSNTA